MSVRYIGGRSGRHSRRVCGHSHGQGPTSEGTIPAPAGVVENDHYLPGISPVIPGHERRRNRGPER